MSWEQIFGAPGSAPFWLKLACVAGFAWDAWLLWRDARRKFADPAYAPALERQRRHLAWNCMAGVVGNFLATLGVGAFATTTALFKLKGSVDDIDIPGTLNVGDAFPTLVQAFLFLGAVEMDPVTLVSMIIAAILGARLGARVVTGWDRARVRLGMGVGLAILGGVMLLRQLGLAGGAGTALGLSGWKLIVAVVVNTCLGALMNIGVGSFGPCLVLCATLGMDVVTAYPVMMGSCSLLMAFGNAPAFIKASRYDLTATLAQAVPGCVSVWAAYRFVRSLSVTALLWVVICVVFVTSALFLKDARRDLRRAH